jgi:hypothetical protein
MSNAERTARELTIETNLENLSKTFILFGNVRTEIIRTI